MHQPNDAMLPRPAPPNPYSPDTRPMQPRSATEALSPQEDWYAANLPLRDQVIADVGANAGRLSEFFWRAGGGSSRVVSVEPLAENIALLKARVPPEAAGCWRIEPCAVSNRVGSVKLHAGLTQGSGWNSVVDPAGARRTRARTLASLVPDVTVVKLDIEGHEHEVLEEALPRLPAVLAWAIELHQRPDRSLQGVLGLLMAYGYRVFAAAREAHDPDVWLSQEISATLDWSAVPPCGVRPDGRPIRTLHVLALRHPPAR
jgi:FkbM family methyltransferase